MAKKPTDTKAKTKAKKAKSKRSIAAKKAKKEMFKPPTLPEEDRPLPKRVGNPHTYKPEYCDKLVEFMSEGYSIDAFAGHINTHISTVYRWLKHGDCEEFREAKKLGEAKQREFWEKVGKAGMLGQLKGFNTSVWIFNMKNRYGWTDKRTDDESKDFESIVIEMPDSNQQQIINITPKNVTPGKEK